MVHDNVIRSYSLDFEAETLTMKTLYHTDSVFEKTDVIFRGYLAHVFENETKGSIIFDIEEYPLNLFLKNERTLLAKKKKYAWPFYYQAETEFVGFFQAHGYKIFEIRSSYGLCGFVFAKQMEINVKEC